MPAGILDSLHSAAFKTKASPNYNPSHYLSIFLQGSTQNMTESLSFATTDASVQPKTQYAKEQRMEKQGIAEG